MAHRAIPIGSEGGGVATDLIPSLSCLTVSLKKNLDRQTHRCTDVQTTKSLTLCYDGLMDGRTDLQRDGITWQQTSGKWLWGVLWPLWAWRAWLRRKRRLSIRQLPAPKDRQTPRWSWDTESQLPLRRRLRIGRRFQEFPESEVWRRNFTPKRSWLVDRCNFTSDADSKGFQHLMFGEDTLLIKGYSIDATLLCTQIPRVSSLDDVIWMLWKCCFFLSHTLMT